MKNNFFLTKKCNFVINYNSKKIIILVISFNFRAMKIVKIGFVLLILFLFGSCNFKKTNKSKKVLFETKMQLFFDSIKNISSENLVQKAQFIADSTFHSFKVHNQSISKNNFKLLMQAVEKQEISYNQFNRIFNFKIDAYFTNSGKIQIRFFSFCKKDSLQHYAIVLGNKDLTWESKVFFFERDRLISEHNVFHKYGLELDFFLDLDMQPIVYYSFNFESGTGVWWFNYFFYKFSNGTIEPVLNILQRSNLNFPLQNRIYSYEAELINFLPLTFKVKYLQEIFGENGKSLQLINDSSIFVYRWNSNFNKFLPDSHNKLSHYQIISYYLGETDFLFIKTHTTEFTNAVKVDSLKSIIFSYFNSLQTKN